MQKDYSIFPIPNFAKQDEVDFDDENSDFQEIYLELNAIAEEIERCRLRNS